MNDEVAKLVPTKPADEIAADLKERISAAIGPVLALMDEAAAHGFLVQWDALQPTPPYFKHRVLGLRLARHY